jgi:hypothetical protein
MMIERFSLAKHSASLSTWYESREIAPPPSCELPEIGFVAINGIDPVAIAFLRRVEGGYGQLDGLVTNPSATSVERHYGLQLVCDEVIAAAKQLKLKGLIAITSDKNIISRAPSHGFRDLTGYRIFGQLFKKKEEN